MNKVVFLTIADTETPLVKAMQKQLDGRADVIQTTASGDNACVPLREVCYSLRGLPDLVVTGGDQEYRRRAALYAADHLGIPTLMLQVGISSDTQNTVGIATKRTVYRLWNHGREVLSKYLYLLRTVQKIGWPPWSLQSILRMILRDVVIAFTVDDANGSFGKRTIAVSGSWGKQSMISRGVDPDEIVVVGNPMMGKLEKRADGDKGCGVLLLTCAQVEHGRWTREQRRLFIEKTVDTVLPLLRADEQLTIKVHPMENLAEYDEMLEDRSLRISLCQSMPLANLIKENRVVLVGGYSTTVLDAAVLGKPVLILNIFGEPEGVPYADMGIATEARSYEQLKMLLSNLLWNQSFRDAKLESINRFCEQNRELVDGKAMERLCDLVMKLCEDRRK